ncbi:unnamed protein product, partial [Meganyctiphanes norvegica]
MEWGVNGDLRRKYGRGGGVGGQGYTGPGPDPQCDYPPTHDYPRSQPHDQHRESHNYPNARLPEGKSHDYPNVRLPEKKHEYPNVRLPEGKSHDYPNVRLPEKKHEYPNVRLPEVKHTYPKPKHHYPNVSLPEGKPGYPNVTLPEGTHHHYPNVSLPEGKHHYPNVSLPDRKANEYPPPLPERGESRGGQEYQTSRQPEVNHDYPNVRLPEGKLEYPSVRLPADGSHTSGSHGIHEFPNVRIQDYPRPSECGGPGRPVPVAVTTSECSGKCGYPDPHSHPSYEVSHSHYPTTTSKVEHQHHHHPQQQQQPQAHPHLPAGPTGSIVSSMEYPPPQQEWVGSVSTCSRDSCSEACGYGTYPVSGRGSPPCSGPCFECPGSCDAMHPPGCFTPPGDGVVGCHMEGCPPEGPGPRLESTRPDIHVRSAVGIITPDVHADVQTPPPGMVECSYDSRSYDSRSFDGTGTSGRSYETRSEKLSYDSRSLHSHHASHCDLRDFQEWREMRGSRESVGTLPAELERHLKDCRCPCDHLGYGNFQTLSESSTAVAHISHSGAGCGSSGCSRRDPPSVYTQLSYLDSPRSTSSNGFPARRKVPGELTPRHWWLVGLVFMVAATAGVGVGVPLALRGGPGQTYEKRLESAKQLLKAHPLIDG